ncbi:MAG: 2-heptaprenyl-1,4-naphthoquinone methyltransferase, partial [Anaerolineae bacterium]|nr:2-heptaprenyl-1,4-naphthoquinone methyltransferase [Anaerolineae bacterium]
RLVVLSLVMREPKGVAIRLYEWAHENIPNYVDCRPIYLQEAIESAGFNNNDTREFSMWGLPGEIVIARKAT